jgi:5'-nucleotidase (lipoprotein e(P4) family)
MRKITIAFFLALASCTVARHAATNTNPGGDRVVTDGKIYTNAYQQSAAEYRALCFQAYNIAHLRVDEITTITTDLPKAIVTDIDETILDNSPYEVHQIRQRKGYDPDSWLQWSAMSAADTVPGSRQFLNYAASKGIEIFYVTNRGESERTYTLKNLQKFDFPDADSAHLFPIKNTFSKEDRRQRIASGHTIMMLLGDNLGDFSCLFDTKTPAERRENVNEVALEFGNRFIVLPNPVYGDWESSLYGYQSNLTPAQMDSAIKVSLHGY